MPLVSIALIFLYIGYWAITYSVSENKAEVVMLFLFTFGVGLLIMLIRNSQWS